MEFVSNVRLSHLLMCFLFSYSSRFLNLSVPFRLVKSSFELRLNIARSYRIILCLFICSAVC